jgi:hypothetical protein
VCAVFDPFKAPQLEAAQLRDQSTPAAAGSLATTATTEAECAEPLGSTYTVFGNTLTLTGTGGGGAVSVSVALMDLVVSVSEVAAIVTVPSVGTAEGAVYVVTPVESVCAGLNVPQALDLQVAVQMTPAPNGSLVTTASRPRSFALICKEAGTTEVLLNAIPIADATIVRLTLLLCDGLLVTVAVIVIEVLMGTCEGAV